MTVNWILVALAALMIAPETFAAEWQWLGEGRQPVVLRSCPPGVPAATITINTSVGTGLPWRRFCYYGSQPRETRPWPKAKRASTK
jgi:hypothetical protein